MLPSDACCHGSGHVVVGEKECEGKSETIKKIWREMATQCSPLSPAVKSYMDVVVGERKGRTNENTKIKWRETVVMIETMLSASESNLNKY